MIWAIKMVWLVLQKTLHQQQQLRITFKTGTTLALLNKLTRVHLCHVLVDLELIWVARVVCHAQHFAKDALTQPLALKKTSKEIQKQARLALTYCVHCLILNLIIFIISGSCDPLTFDDGYSCITRSYAIPYRKNIVHLHLLPFRNPCYNCIVFSQDLQLQGRESFFLGFFV